MPVTTTPPAAAPRGFRVDRGEGALPGSLHGNPRLAQWLAFDEPGVVRVFTGKVELGQGILTALQLIVADELDVAIDAVRLHSASTARGPDEGMTSGSLSIQDSGGALRQACAELRALATRVAAERSDTAPERIAVRDGRFTDDRGRDLGDYWSLLVGTDLDVPCTGVARPKPAAARRLFGQARPARVDLPDKVFGRARFIHDLRLPGLLHGRVLRGRLGVHLQELGAELALALRLPRASGALVTELDADSPAARAGLRPGDVVVAFDGKGRALIRRQFSKRIAAQVQIGVRQRERHERLFGRARVSRGASGTSMLSCVGLVDSVCAGYSTRKSGRTTAASCSA